VNSLSEAIKYFLVIMAELSILFLGISAVIALAFMYIPKDKINHWIGGKGLWGNIMGVLFGAVTPFCACSTVPMTLGFLQAGVPFGAVMSFVISSPLMDPLIFSLLVAFLGWKVALGFFFLTSAFAVVFGVLLEKLGWADQVKNVQMKKIGPDPDKGVPEGFKNRLHAAVFKAWGDFQSVFIYMIVGVGIGAAIYGYLPEDLLVEIAGAGHPLSVVIVALIGMPLYLRVESAIPIGLALMEKGASIGAVIALIISGAGIAIPELTMLAGIFKKKIIIGFSIIVFVSAVLSGLIFNLLA